MTYVTIFLACVFSTLDSQPGTANLKIDTEQQQLKKLNQAEMDQLLRDGILLMEKSQRTKDRSKMG